MILDIPDGQVSSWSLFARITLNWIDYVIYFSIAFQTMINNFFSENLATATGESNRVIVIWICITSAQFWDWYDVCLTPRRWKDVVDEIIAKYLKKSLERTLRNVFKQLIVYVIWSGCSAESWEALISSESVRGTLHGALLVEVKLIQWHWVSCFVVGVVSRGTSIVLRRPITAASTKTCIHSLAKCPTSAA